MTDSNVGQMAAPKPPPQAASKDDSYGYGYGYSEYGYTAEGPARSGAVLDIRRIARLGRLYWRFFAVVTLVVLAIGAFISFAIPDRYSSEVRVLVLSDQVSIINLDAVTTGVTSDLTGLLSEIEMIASPQVTQRVLNDLGTDGQLRMVTTARNAESLAVRFEEFSRWIRGLMQQSSAQASREADPGATEPTTTEFIGLNLQNEAEWITDLPADEALMAELGPQEVYRKANDMLEKNLKVQQVGRSRVISIEITASEPRLAADLANRLASAYIGAQIQSKFDAARLAKTLLNQQLLDLREQISGQESEIETYRARTGLTNSDTVILAGERVQQLDQTLTGARARLASIQARKQEAESVRENRSLIESTADVLRSDFVSDLRAREIELERDATTLADRLLPGHPDLIRVSRELSQLRGRIASEINKIVLSISSEENTLLAEIAVLQRTLDSASSEVVELNRAEREIEALSMELLVNRSLVETFISRSRETEVQEDFQQADAEVIARAQAAVEPSGPNRPIMAALSLIAALGVGAGSVLMREFANPRSRSMENIREVTGIPLLGILPDVRKFLNLGGSDVAMLVRENPSERISDLLRRMYLKLSSAHNMADSSKGSSHREPQDLGASRVVLVTSSRPNEGKTSIACSLAFTARRFGKRVIILDGDLRKPSIARTFGVSHEEGIVDFLNETADIGEIVHDDDATGVQYIVRGNRSDNPSELIELGRMRLLIRALREYYDLIIIDSAPVLAAPETRQLALVADQIVFVLNWSLTKRSEFASAIGEIADIPRFDDRASLILNQVPAVEMRFLDLPQASYLSYYRYGDYGPADKTDLREKFPSA